MSSLTKDQLKSELINHGVALPPSSARKEEYVRLYEEHVAPLTSKTDFSSDEEGFSQADEDVQPQAKVTELQLNGKQDDSLVVNDFNVATLPDDELFNRLKEYGVVGPIVDSTRAFYQRKLVVLMREGPPGRTAASAQVENHASGANGQSVVDNDHYSDDSEPEPELSRGDLAVEEPEPVRKPSPKPEETLRKRTIPTLTTDRPPSTLSALPLVDRQGTPIPRKSIHSAKYEIQQQETVTYSRYIPDEGTKVQRIEPQPKTFRFGTILKVLIVLILVACGVLAYQKFSVHPNFMDIFEQKAAEVLDKIDHAAPNQGPIE